jgi:hypothetical protein
VLIFTDPYVVASRIFEEGEEEEEEEELGVL